jgi:hypothetical protein
MKILTLLVTVVVLFTGCKHGSDRVDLKYIPVKSGNYWGYIDHEGKFSINPQFNYAFAFSEGLALVQNAEGKFGYIDEKGKYIINPTFKQAMAFSEGLALVVKEDSQLEYIDKTGKTSLILPPEIDKAFSFSDGLAPVSSNGKYGYIDTKGKIIVPTKYAFAKAFSSGLGLVAELDEKTNSMKWGYVNKQNEVKIKCQFSYAYNFSNELAMVQNGTDYGYIDKEGSYKINPQFKFATDFNGDYACIKQGDLFGYIDKEGKIAINPQYKSAEGFVDGVAVVSNSEGKFGTIDDQGTYKITPQFDYLSRFYDDIAIISMGNKIGMINAEGKIVVNPQFDNFNDKKDNDNYLQSDYFDVSAVVKYILGEISKDAIAGFTVTENFKSLKNKFSDLSLYNYYDFKSFTPKESRLVQLRKMHFEFADEIINSRVAYTPQQVYDPTSGGYTTVQTFSHMEQSANEEAKLAYIELSYSLLGKGAEKVGEVAKGIADAINGKFGYVLNTTDQTDPPSQFVTLENENFGVSTNRLSQEYNLVMSIRFIKNPVTWSGD